MKGIILLIDTADNTKIHVSLSHSGENYTMVEETGKKRAQAVLPVVEKLLEGHSLSLQDLTAIEVNAGPGSFTGLRVGISIANTLAKTLQIPVNGKSVGELVEPIYQ